VPVPVRAAPDPELDDDVVELESGTPRRQTGGYGPH
jgi:hypothetical protein